MSASRIVRAVWGTATVVFGALGFLLRGVGVDTTKLFAASAACGLLWWFWDLLMEHVVAPLGLWMGDISSGGTMGYKPSRAKDTIRFLERRLESDRSPRGQIKTALRLVELYRHAEKNPEKAARLLEEMRDRYPDVPELERFSKAWDRSILGSHDE